MSGLGWKYLFADDYLYGMWNKVSFVVIQHLSGESVEIQPFNCQLYSEWAGGDKSEIQVDKTVVLYMFWKL